MIAANPVTLPLNGYSAQHVQLAVADGIATLTLNRPERKNPLTFESYAELANIFRAAARDKSIRAIVITGAGAISAPAATCLKLSNRSPRWARASCSISPA